MPKFSNLFYKYSERCNFKYVISKKHMKICSTSLASREMQIKMMRYHYTPTAKMKNTDSTKQ